MGQHSTRTLIDQTMNRIFTVIAALFLAVGGAQRIGATYESDLLTNVHVVKAMVFPVVVYIWELDHKEG